MTKPVLIGLLLACTSLQADPMRPVSVQLLRGEDAPRHVVDQGYRLMGMIAGAEGYRANINARWVRVGERIGDATVSSIDPQSVSLRLHSGKTLKLTMARGDIKRALLQGNQP